MSHDHHHIDDHHTGRIRFAFWLNTLFVGIEVIGGFMTNSVAILSDAAHDLGDSISLGIAWYLQHLSMKSENDAYTFGYRRFSVLGALFNSLVLFAGSVWIISTSIPRLFETTDVNSTGMLGLAIAGIVINAIGFYILTGGKSINERVVSLHLLEDVLGWIAILIGAVVILLWDFNIIDPILSIAIALFILFNVYRNSRSIIVILLQRAPKNVSREEVENLIRDTDGVEDIHELRMWTLDNNSHVLNVVIVISPEWTADQIDHLTDELKHRMKKLKINHATFEITIFK